MEGSALGASLCPLDFFIVFDPNARYSMFDSTEPRSMESPKVESIHFYVRNVSE